ncbi:hypothetical protein OsJ_01715 [Oryza sativa Japonica Group]|uniref:Uncharacterized protein n=1 Tax=Oryza sativa subsp. japonica TaxID=39947 RepID=B9EWN6_ORYSJ|nr:hypothetical protein OsJ_01715 [Oryza sativa Japonica Group]
MLRRPPPCLSPSCAVAVAAAVARAQETLTLDEEARGDGKGRNSPGRRWPPEETTAGEESVPSPSLSRRSRAAPRRAAVPAAAPPLIAPLHQEGFFLATREAEYFPADDEGKTPGWAGIKSRLGLTERLYLRGPVLWPECGWRPVSLTDLITAASVKKEYRKATLCIHPDKVQQKGANLQQKYIAEKVFDLLKGPGLTI